MINTFWKRFINSGDLSPHAPPNIHLWPAYHEPATSVRGAHCAAVEVRPNHGRCYVFIVRRPNQNQWTRDSVRIIITLLCSPFHLRRSVVPRRTGFLLLARTQVKRYKTALRVTRGLTPTTRTTNVSSYVGSVRRHLYRRRLRVTQRLKAFFSLFGAVCGGAGRFAKPFSLFLPQ